MEKNHGVLITGVQLMIDMCKLDTKVIVGFRKFVPHLVRIFSSLLQYGFSPEYDVGGVTDPFLQVKILRLLRMLGEGDAESSDLMNVVLAGVATNTDNVRNVGNSILYECVNTIMGIDSEAGLRVLAINTLARFLAHRDNNIRYVALNTLCTVVNLDMEAVQRHRNTIVDCLKDNDISIRRRALELVYSLVNTVNVRVLVRELVNFLSIADFEFRHDLTAKLCIVAEKYAPTPRWQIDTILRVMTIAGEYVPESTCNALLGLIAGTSDIQSYAVQKMYLALTTDITQQTLVRSAVWCIGEFGDLLLNSGSPSNSSSSSSGASSSLVSTSGDLLSDILGVSPASVPVAAAPVPAAAHLAHAGDGEDEVAPSIRITERELIDLFQSILSNIATRTSTKRQVLTALLKLTTRMPNSQAELKALIAQYDTHINVELQQRATEYEKILEIPQLPGQLLIRIPAPEAKTMISAAAVNDHAPTARQAARQAAAASSSAARGSEGTPQKSQKTSSAASSKTSAAPAPEVNLLDMDLLSFNGSGASNGASSSGGADVLAMLSGTTISPSPSPQIDLMGDLMGGGGSLMPTNTAPADVLGQFKSSLTPASPSGSPIPFSASPSAMGAMGASSSSPAPSAWSQQQAVKTNDGVLVLFDFSKPQPASPQFTLVNATFINQGMQQVTDVELKLSLPKYLKLQVLPATSTALSPLGGQATQQIKLANTLQGQKPVLMRLRLEYKINGEAKAEMAEPVIPEGI